MPSFAYLECQASFSEECVEKLVYGAFLVIIALDLH